MRLITFGCSLTYGQNMPDNAHISCEPYTLPSNMSWPSQLGKIMGAEVANYGRPAASNKEIWHTAMQSDLKKTDVVVILWTHFDRWCTVRKNEDTIYLRAHPSVVTKNKEQHYNTDKRKYAEAYYTHIHDSYDSKVDFLLRCNHLHTHLNSMGIKNFHYSARKPINTFEPELLKWNKVPSSDTTLMYYRKKYSEDLALDGKHPGSKVYGSFAKKIYDEIKDELP